MLKDFDPFTKIFRSMQEEKVLTEKKKEEAEPLEIDSEKNLFDLLEKGEAYRVAQIVLKSEKKFGRELHWQLIMRLLKKTRDYASHKLAIKIIKKLETKYLAD